jgi:hypothetical protein
MIPLVVGTALLVLATGLFLALFGAAIKLLSLPSTWLMALGAVLLGFFLLAGCSSIWSHRPDCVFGLASAGCAPGTTGYEQALQQWYRAGATQQDFAMDQGQCQAQGFGVPGASVLQAALVYNACMRGKGWELH